MTRFWMKFIGKINIQEDDYEQLIEEIISSATSIDKDSNKIAQFVIHTMEVILDEYRVRMENLKSKARMNEELAPDQIKVFLKKGYEMKKKLFLIGKKTEIIEELIRPAFKRFDTIPCYS